MIQFLNVFFTISIRTCAVMVFILGSWLRYDYGPIHLACVFQPDAGQTGMVLWSNLFQHRHSGDLFGHLFGMLTPHWMYAWFLPIAVNSRWR